MPFLESFKKEIPAKIAVSCFALLTAWWLIEQFIRLQNPAFESNFAHVYGITAILGGIWGLAIAKHWGGFKSALGKAVGFLSIGLLAQFFGQFAYSLYFFIFQLEVPYPSIGDLGFFGSIAFYILGVWYLAKVTGIKIGIKSFANKLQAIVIPVLMLVAAYTLFLQGYEFDWNTPLTIFLDFGYPLGQAIYISIAILTYTLSRNLLGGIMKNRILFILGALLVQFLSDYTFLYQAKSGTWHPGGVNDFMYLVAYFLMTIALVELKTVYDYLKTA